MNLCVGIITTKFTDIPFNDLISIHYLLFIKLFNDKIFKYNKKTLYVIFSQILKYFKVTLPKSFLKNIFLK